MSPGVSYGSKPAADYTAQLLANQPAIGSTRDTHLQL